MSVRTVYIELRASAEKLRADMVEANSSVLGIGKSGEESGKRMARGMNDASLSLRKVAESATEATLAVAGAYRTLTSAVARYGVAAVSASGGTEGLVNTYRALRIALSPTPLTIATVATGVLAEETIRLVNARAKLIEQQSLMAATQGRSVGGIELIHSAANISGSSETAIQGLINAVGKNAADSPGNYHAGLSALGMTPAEADAMQWVDMLGKVAKGFDSIDDPARRATLAVQLFGKEHAGEALEQLTPAFASAASATSQFGLTLSSVSRQQIFTFRRDMQDLKTELTDFSGLKAWGQSVTSMLAQIGAAYWDMSKRATTALGDLLDKKTGFRAIGTDVPDEDLGAYARSHQGIGRNQTQDSINSRVLADDLFVQSQAAALRQSLTLEGKKKSLEDAKAQQEAAYDALTLDQQKRAVNGNDPTLMSGDQYLQMVVRRQSAQAMISSLQGQITAMEKAEEEAKKLAEFQTQASERLNALYQASTLSRLKDPVAQTMFEGRVEVGRDADKTSPEEKEGRAQIETENLRAAASALQLKVSQDFLNEQTKASSAALAAFGKTLQKATEDADKSAEEQRKIDAGQMQSARSLGEHGVRMAGIQSEPGNEAQLAKEVLNTRLQTIYAERAILDAHRESYTVAQAQVEDDRLDTETKAAQLEYAEQIAALQKELAQSALQAGGAYQQKLRQLAQEVAALNQIKVTSENIQDIEASRHALADQILEVTVQQKLALGGLKAGYDAFFLSMQEQAEKPGKILYDGMHAAAEGLSDDLSKLVFGNERKGGVGKMFGKTFESVGQGMVKSSAQAMLQKGLARLGNALHIHASNAKTAAEKSGPNGSDSDPFYVIIKGESPVGPAGAAPNLGAIAPSMRGLGVMLPNIGGFFGKLFGRGDLAGISSGIPSVTSSISFMANGGDADPGRVYGVAEAGEAELISPKNSSRITPLSKLGMGGDTHLHYTIDARGADLGAENRIMRAIEFVHSSAVSNGVRANSERAKRTPQRSR